MAGHLLNRRQSFHAICKRIEINENWVGGNFAVIFIFIPFTTREKNKQVVILRMAFRARKVHGTFEKRAPGMMYDLYRMTSLYSE